MDNVITLIDAGTGNLRSVQKALEKLGAKVHLTSSPKGLSSAKKIILPGVGAFGDFMQGLRIRGLVAPLISAAFSGVPLLGICVGMQSFFEMGFEMGQHQGLGLIPGRVIPFPNSSPIKIPQTGWNRIWYTNESPLFKHLAQGEYVYFNHSYYCEPTHRAHIAAETNYGMTYCSALTFNNIFGVQFHPEKSQVIGLKILENFLWIAQ